jgi:phosphohistidine swiveling domain-containing protein
MRVIALGETESLDASAVGHKAANLARFASSYRVPPAFCLSTSVYAELKAALGADGTAERAALRAGVADGYARLAATVGQREPRVAVRSSAAGEDSAEASFAGQHETILNVRGVDAVVGAVLECWRSVGNERVMAYRREKGIDAKIEVAVIVQQMVDADASAIAFGADPVSGDTEVVVVDAARGLGDKIASGEITPDTYRVRKNDLDVCERSGDALTDTQVREVIRLVLALERENGHAVDVECAFAKGELYLLQCRPITTLLSQFPVTWRTPADEKLHWRRDDAHAGEPHPRLITDYTEYGPSRGLQRRAEIYDLPLMPRLEMFAGRIYTTAQRRDLKRDVDEHQRSAMARVREDARLGRARWDEEYLPRLRAHYAWYEATTAAAATLSREELAARWDEAWERVGDVWLMHMLTVWAGFVMGDALAEMYEKQVGGTAIDALKMTQGYAGTLQQLERDLHRLAALRARDDAGFESAMRDFLASPHGNLGSSGEDMTAPVWRDDPALLLAELDRRNATSAEDPDARLARLIAEGEAVAARAREALRDRPEDLARFEDALRLGRAIAPLTEEHNYHLDRQMQAIMRRLFLAYGARLVTDGQLATAEDVFWFHVKEIAGALRDRRDLRDLARERELEFAAWHRLRHPTALGAPAGAVHAFSPRTDLNYRAKQDEQGVLKGVPASGGRRRGRACLVRGLSDFDKLKPGDVLVCRSSNVSWVPLFTIAAAVVTDVGGSLSHAAVVAREFGVPAVVGAGVALATLRDGQLIEVDGDRGTVRLLD